jgi:hypothetical protein
MGRELKRVPLDFDWPLNTVWGGFINPFHHQSTKCPNCDGSGYSKEYKQLEARWYSHLVGGFRPEDRGSTPYTPDDPLVRRIITAKINHDAQASRFYGTTESAIRQEAQRMCAIWNSSWSHHLNADDVDALLKADRLWDFTRTPRPGFGEGAPQHSNGWLKKSNGYVPPPKEVNDWSLCGFGHDSSNCWIVIKAELKRLGLPHLCARCNGEAQLWPTPAIKRRSDRFKETAPPTGEGFQIWETVSEGSPISPVFATPEELADWMVSHPWNSCDNGTTRDQWLRFIKGPGLSVSMVSDSHGVRSGVQAAVG